VIPWKNPGEYGRDHTGRTYQAMTRVKDSAGLEPSAIMAIYCTPVDVEKITSWGMIGPCYQMKPTLGLAISITTFL
jgi:hypothetical protein